MFLEECEGINEQILDSLGITFVGHRIKLINASAAMGTTFPGTFLLTVLAAKKSELTNTEGPPRKGVIPEESPFGNTHASLRHLISSMNLQLQSGVWINVSELEFTKKLGEGTSGTVWAGMYPRGN